MRIGKIARGAEYRMDKQFENLLISWYSIVLQIETKSENFLIFQVVKFWKLLNFPI